MRKLLWPGVAAAIAFVILLSLGFWQLGRLQQKAAQLEALRSSMTSAATPLDPQLLRRVSIHEAGLPSVGGTEFAELTRVSITGTYLPARSVPVRATLPATKGAQTSGIGFFWMTPLLVDGDTVVFINRGFVPSGGDWRPPAVPTPEGQQTIVGLMRAPENPRTFTPADNPAKGEYFSRQPQLMGRAVGVDPAKVANFFIDAERGTGEVRPPVGVDAREMIARIPNNHLQYAVTWFAFAATLVGVFGFFARARLKEPAEETQ